MKFKILVLIFLTATNPCKEKMEKPKSTQSLLTENVEFKELLKQVIEISDSIEDLENNLYLKTLVAIQNNDSSIINDLRYHTWTAENLYRKQTLKLLGEPQTLLEIDTSVKTVYRMDYDRSFRDETILITAKETNKGYFIETIIFEGCRFGKKVTDKCTKILKKAAKKISKEQWNELTKKVHIAQFWRLKELKPVTGFDGSFWNLEGYHRRHHSEYYNFVSRWSPPEHNDFREICEYMIKITEINIGRIF